MNTEKLKLLQEELKLVQNHIDSHWIQNNEAPTKHEITQLHKTLKEAVSSLGEIIKEIQVFK